MTLSGSVGLTATCGSTSVPSKFFCASVSFGWYGHGLASGLVAGLANTGAPAV